MEAGDNNHGPGLAKLASRLAATSVGLLENRAELLAVELQEEKLRVIKLLAWGLGLLFLSVLAVGLLTATVILLIPEEQRVWAAAGFTLLYLIGAVVAVFVLKSALKKLPFGETLNQIRRDRDWLTSLRQ
jgi:uncharacterized membrane protein YqjE